MQIKKIFVVALFFIPCFLCIFEFEQLNLANSNDIEADDAIFPKHISNESNSNDVEADNAIFLNEMLNCSQLKISANQAQWDQYYPSSSSVDYQLSADSSRWSLLGTRVLTCSPSITLSLKMSSVASFSDTLGIYFDEYTVAGTWYDIGPASIGIKYGGTLYTRTQISNGAGSFLVRHEQAHLMFLGTSYSGSITETDFYEAYQLDLMQGKNYVLTISPDSNAQLAAVIYHHISENYPAIGFEGRGVEGQRDGYSSSPGEKITMSFSADYTTSYLILISLLRPYSGFGNFGVSLDYESPPQNYPSAPTIGVPEIVKTGVQYEFSAVSTDTDVGEKIRYGWDWTGDQVPEYWSPTSLDSGIPDKVLKIWNCPDTIHLRVVAEDSTGKQSWSEEKIINILKFYAFHFVVSIEWSATPEEIISIKQALVKATEIFYNALDSQMIISSYDIFDNKRNFDKCQIRFYNRVIENHAWAEIGAFDETTIGNGYVHLSKGFNGAGTLNPGDWNKEYGPYCIAHELIHFIGGCFEEYKDKDGNIIPKEDRMDTLMGREFYCFEISNNYWYSHTSYRNDTLQYARCGKGCWETINDRYSVTIPSGFPKNEPIKDLSSQITIVDYSTGATATTKDNEESGKITFKKTENIPGYSIDLLILIIGFLSIPLIFKIRRNKPTLNKL